MDNDRIENGPFPDDESGMHDKAIAAELRFLGGLVAKIPDEAPPDALLAGVMAGLTPKKRPRPFRFLAWLTRPRYVNLAPIRLVPVVAVLLLFLVWPGFRPSPPGRDDGPGLVRQVATGTQYHHFAITLPKSSSVALIGDFNNWNPQGYEMAWDEANRCWALSVPLGRGRYRYAFLVDGGILADPKAVFHQDDGFGHKNSIVIINNGKAEDQTI